MCRHEQAQLVGTADGILCRACGKIFANFEELEQERDPKEEPQAEQAKPKRGTKKKKEAGE